MMHAPMDPHNKENRIKINKVCQEGRAARVRHSELTARMGSGEVGAAGYAPSQNYFLTCLLSSRSVTQHFYRPAQAIHES